MDQPRPRFWTRARLSFWAVSLVLIVGVGFLLRPMESSREYAAHTECKFRLQSIGIALHNYHAAYGSFPPAHVTDESARPIHSWRVLLLPFLDEWKLYEDYRFDEAWDSPHNARIAERMPEVYRCPAGDERGARGTTNYVVLVGPGAVFDGHSGTALLDVVDDRAQTILVVETAARTVPWTEPRDLSPEELLRDLRRTQKPDRRHEGGMHVVLVDGSVRSLSPEISGETLRSLVSIAGGEAVREV